MENVLNQSDFAALHGIKRQRVGQLIKQGELMTQFIGKRVYLINNKFNADVLNDFCHGQGNWNRPRSYY